MLWTLVIVGALIVAGGGAAFFAALASNSKKEQRRALEVVPGVASSAPKAWAGAHTPEAKLHRRLAAAVAAAHAQMAIGGGAMVSRVATLDAAAVTLDERLIAAAALPAKHRVDAVTEIEQMVDRFERAIATLATDGAASAELNAAFDQAVSDIEAELAALAAARAEVEHIDRKNSSS